MRPQLIDTIAEIQDYVPVNMTSDMDVVSPFIAAAENMYLVKQVIGQEQFDAFATAYKNADKVVTDITDVKIRQAVIYCQNIVSNLGYYLGTPVLSLSIGSSGIQITSNENTKNAFQWQVNDLKSALMDLGFAAIESLLALLESDTLTFLTYAGSAQRQAVHSLLIRSADDFSRHYDINSSRFIFKTMSYIMKRVEDQVVKRIFGTAFFETVKENDEPDEKTKFLIDNFLKPGIALLTIAKATTERIITFQEGTVGVNFRGRFENMKESLAPTAAQIADAVDPLNADGNTFLQDGIEYVLANLTSFPDYVQPELRRGFKFKNKRHKGVWGA